jgi:hypothetical protein
MAFATRKEVQALEARIAKIEEKLTVGVSVPSIENVLTLHDVFGDDLAGLLSEAGYSSVEAVKVASDDDLKAIPGIGAATVNKIRTLTNKE